ncbi:hypothetical protein V1290_003782 [Bradyrhizobium sp. AZCC 1578]|uniref:AAA family ATPase n=1 Tax=Bradyrhizobium sp. AZCC 1578 TaxID=3117027 RepID=UPI002FF05BD2
MNIPVKPPRTKGTNPKLDKAWLLKALESLPGCVAIPLGKAGTKRAKNPADFGWQKKAYNSAKVIDRCIAEGRNVGFRLSPRVLVVDNDRRNWESKGLDPFLVIASNLGIDVDAGPKWKTGGGGYHKPYVVAEDQVGKFRKSLDGEENAGLEFRNGQGQMIVAPGSLHPSGNLYEVEREAAPVKAPKKLLALARRPEGSGEGVGGGTYSVEQLERALASIDPADFDSHDTWFPLMQSCHHATGGDGRDAFVAWSTSDSNFANDGHMIARRWDTLDPNKNDGVTFKTLNKALRDHGDSSLIPSAATGAADDFDDAPDIPDEDEAEDMDFDTPPELAFELAAYVPKDPTKIPKREWLYAPTYIRKFMGLTAATGGAGKSSLILVEAVAMACGIDLLGIKPVAPLRVFYWNGEDPLEELERRVEAILKYYKLTKRDLGDRLFIMSGRDMEIRIAELDNGKVKIAKPMTRAMVRAIRKHKLDVVIIDPFVSSHGVPENDNGAIEVVAKKWAAIADKTNCAVQLSHHTRKTGGGPASIEDSRGASSLNYAARTRRAINTMTAAEAKGAGITDDRARLSYFKADTANSSMTKPTAANDWYRFESVNLMNGGPDEITGAPLPGDSVGVVVAWEYKKLALELSADDAREAVTALEEGGPWRADKRADKWAGLAVAKAAGVDPTDDAVKAQIAALIEEWIKDGTLEEYTGTDDARRPKKCLRPMIDFG